MNIYEAIKECVLLAQKTDNIPMYKTLLDVQKQSLELLEENAELKARIRKYEEQEENAARIIRHADAYITLKDEDQNIIFCSGCWDKDRKLVQVQMINTGRYQCPVCKTVGYTDKKAFDESQRKAIRNIGRGIGV